MRQVRLCGWSFVNLGLGEIDQSFFGFVIAIGRYDGDVG